MLPINLEQSIFTVTGNRIHYDERNKVKVNQNTFNLQFNEQNGHSTYL